MNNADVDNRMISNKVSFGKQGFKYFAGHNSNENVKPLRILLPRSLDIQSFARDFLGKYKNIAKLRNIL